MRTIQSLQAGRGVAALAVVIHHSSLSAYSSGGPFTGFKLLRLGYLGVDFFFVLSGFIIYHSTVGRDRTIRDYSLARFRRVFLPYWPVGIGIALLYLAFPGLSHAVRPWSWLPTLTLLPVDAPPALSVAWTLKHEILFYALFGLFYFSGLLWLGLAAWALSIMLGLSHLPFQSINLEFLFGIAACLAFRAGKAPVSLMLLAIPALALAYLTSDRVFVGLAFALLIAPLSQLESKDAFKVPAALILLGAASYSLYLVHLLAVSTVARLVGGAYPMLALAVIASLLAGFAYHFLVEVRVVKAKWNPEVFLVRGTRRSPPL